jgi:phage gpG-like protein
MSDGNFRIRVGVVSTAPDKLKQLARKLRPGLKQAMQETLNEVWGLASKKISGPVLRVRSGHLRRSLGPAKTTATETGVEGSLGAQAVYARILEEGGTIPAHVVRPRHGKALRFPVSGGAGGTAGVAFAKSVRIPAVKMPARPYLRPSFAEALPAGRDRFARIIAETWERG